MRKFKDKRHKFDTDADRLRGRRQAQERKEFRDKRESERLHDYECD